MNNLEFKNPTVVENDCNFKILRFDVCKDGETIGNLYENYSIEYENVLQWRLFLYVRDAMEFQTFFDVVAYLSTL